MTTPLAYEEIGIGDTWNSPARTITESDVSNFAWLTGDFNRLHMDENFARHTPFRRPIAHGLLGLAVVAGLGSDSPSVETAAFVGISDWKFLKPIYFGDTVHVRTEVLDAQPRGRRHGLVTWKRQLINQDNAVVQEGTFQTMVNFRRAVRSSAAIAHAVGQPGEMAGESSMQV